MTILLIWLIAFAVIFYFTYTRWNKGFSGGLDNLLPSILKSHGDDRLLWSAVLAVLGATTLVNPVDMLLVAILLGIIGFIVVKLVGWAGDRFRH
ncbi:hypothetical protein R5M92_01800 [Halomonas sp. Bachu 37]|uniref:hypothetical protein n=1 Tax=Halomonas kashgarensis TaxID=3084920 RepID=UPI0032180F25